MGNNECTIITLESSKEWDNNTSSNCIEVFKEKPVRLFGFEINPSGAISEMSSSGGSSGGDEISPNTSRDAITSKRLIKVGNKSSNNKFKCQSCLKAFGSSQALGGHQNAHKKQKTTMKSNKKIQAAAKKAAQHEHGGTGVSNTASSWCFDDQCCSESQINFSSSDPIWYSAAVAKAKKTHDEDPKTTTTRLFTLTSTSDHNNDLNLVDSTKSFNKLLDLQLGLSLHSNLVIYS